MHTRDFDYDLPPELIAQAPPAQRGASRMLVVHRGSGRLEHRQVAELGSCLEPGDLLVVNDTRVIPARVFGEREDTGGKVEVLLIEALEPAAGAQAGTASVWDAFYRASGKARPGLRLRLAGGRLRGRVEHVGAEGNVRIGLSSSEPLNTILAEQGFAPVPPYIRRAPEHGPETAMDRERYQTVFARRDGSVAAPTAGLHFSDDLLSRLEARGVRRTALTLHVGPGTFRPVKTERIEDHVMDSERYAVGPAAADAVRRTRARHSRVVAVGSTAVRTLETMAREDGTIRTGEGRTSLFIRPPYTFKTVDAMLTNFHLPRSTLLMMVCALAGQDLTFEAYAEAIRQRYRFYSYGDCMLIL